ncbi:MAG: glycosyltransferase [Lachnospiraceae bacterium]|nr:glycosyltransferase [Lachnospiraceae bacterium]
MTISAVMPIYNTGEQLYKTLLSLLAQTEADFELLMIDDCSTDQLTVQIEETFARFDPRFKLRRNEKNMGAAPSRNRGMKMAEGEYLICLDSDDLFAPEMMEIYSRTLEENHAQIAIGSFLMKDIRTGETSLIVPQARPGITDRVFSLKELPDDGLNLWWPIAWNKMLRTSFLRETGIEYLALPGYEDLYFGFASALRADRIAYCPLGDALIIYLVGGSGQLSYRADPRSITRSIEKLLIEESSGNHAHAICQIMRELIMGVSQVLGRPAAEDQKQEYLELVKKLVAEYTTEDSFEEEACRIRRRELLGVL